MAKDYGIKISQAGFAVQTATARQLAFSSKYKMFKEYLSGTGTLSLGGASTDASVTINHALGYKPGFFIFVNMPSGTVIAGLEGVYRVPMRNGRNFYHVYGVSDENNLTIKVRNSPASGVAKSFTYKYYILVDKAEA